MTFSFSPALPNCAFACPPTEISTRLLCRRGHLRLAITRRGLRLDEEGRYLGMRGLDPLLERDDRLLDLGRRHVVAEFDAERGDDRIRSQMSGEQPIGALDAGCLRGEPHDRFIDTWACRLTN